MNEINLVTFESLIAEACKRYGLELKFIVLVYFYDMPGDSFLTPVGEISIEEKDKMKKDCEKLLNEMIKTKRIVFKVNDLEKVGCIKWKNGIVTLAGPDGIYCVKLLGYALNKLGLISNHLMEKFEKL